MSGIANQAALAIEGAQLFAAQQEEQWVTTALLTVAESVNSTLDLAQTLETLVRLTPMLVGVSRCGVLQWEADARCFVGGAAYGLTPEAETQFTDLVLTPGSDLFLRALATSPETVSAGAGLSFAIPAALSLFGVSALLGLPLIAKGMLVGAMLVDHPGSDGIADQRRMNILTGTAQQAALAIETARLQADSVVRQRMERELEVAQGIQRSFLPQQLPTIPGWDVLCILSGSATSRRRLLRFLFRYAAANGGSLLRTWPIKASRRRCSWCCAGRICGRRRSVVISLLKR